MTALADYLARLQPEVEDVWVHADAAAAFGFGDGNGFTEHQVGGRRIRVYMPAWDEDSPFRTCATPAALRDAVEGYEKAVGVPWRLNGQVTSDLLLRSLRDGQGNRAAWLARAEMPPPEIWSGQNVEQDAHYTRPAPDGRWLHGYDLNAAYLPAAGTVELPVGALTHLASGADPAIGRRRPGYWRTSDGAWQTSPTLVYRVEDLGQALEVVEGWTWDRHGRHLRAWYERLRDARATLMVSGPPEALAAVKQTYTKGIGYLGSAAKAERRSPLYQPYWQQAVKALARCNLYRKLRKLTDRPVLIWTDAVYFATDNPDAGQVAAALGIPLGPGLGRFKHHGTYRLDEPLHIELPNGVSRDTTLREAIGQGFGLTQQALAVAQPTGGGQ